MKPEQKPSEQPVMLSDSHWCSKVLFVTIGTVVYGLGGAVLGVVIGMPAATWIFAVAGFCQSLQIWRERSQKHTP